MLEEGIRFYVEPYKGCPNYQVRVVTLEKMLDTMSPLIIGESDVLLGFGQEASRTDSCFHFHDRTAAKLAKKFYELLWLDPSAVPLKGVHGLEEDNIKLLRDSFKRNAEAASSAPIA